MLRCGHLTRNRWDNLRVIETGNFKGKKLASRGHLYRRLELLFQSSSEVWILGNPGSGMRDDRWCGKKMEFRWFWCFHSRIACCWFKKWQGRDQEKEGWSAGGHQRWITYFRESEWHECQSNILKKSRLEEGSAVFLNMFVYLKSSMSEKTPLEGGHFL